MNATLTVIVKKSYKSIASRKKRLSCAAIYSEPCWSGEEVEVCNGIPDVAVLGKFTLSSWYAHSKYVDDIVFYPETNYRGWGKSYNAGEFTNILGDPEFQKVAASAKSIRMRPACK